MFEEKIVWHEITTRPLTEEEKAEYAESGYDDYEIPMYSLEDHGDWDGVKAWADMPKYKGGDGDA